jgi:hypothetical protein
MVPTLPVIIEVMIVYPLIVTREVARVFRRDTHDDPRYKALLNVAPRPVVDGRPEPVTPVVPIPEIIVEIDAGHVRHHIDIAVPTGNCHNIRRFGKLEGRRSLDRGIVVNFFRGERVDCIIIINICRSCGGNPLVGRHYDATGKACGINCGNEQQTVKQQR